MIRRKITIFALSVTVALFMACQHDSQEDNKASTPIRLAATVGDMAVTRVSSVPVSVNESQNEYFDANAFLRIYAYKTGTTTTVSNSKNDANLTLGTKYKTQQYIRVDQEYRNTLDIIDNGREPTFPTDNGGAVDIVAVYPDPQLEKSTFTDTNESANPLTFTVQADQTTAAAYKASDLMTAYVTNKTKKPSPIIDLPFYHKMAKITITYKAGKGSPAITRAEILGIKRTVTFNRLTSEVSTPATGGDDAILIYSNDDGSSDEYTASAVVPQQSQKSINTEFVKFTFFGGGTVAYKLEENLTLSPGKQYIYSFTVNADAVKCNANTIESWQTGEARSYEDASMGGNQVIDL